MENLERKSLYDDLMSSGFSDKYAKFYIKCIEEEEQNPLYNKEYGRWALEKGFLYSNARAYALDDNNYCDYLSDKDFYKLWPINSWSRIWVDDKLTLKYMLNGTEFSHIMPKYYYYSTPNGLRGLMDNQDNGQSIEDLILLIKKVGEIACKPNNGTGSNGFYKLSFANNNFFINKSKTDIEEVRLFVKEHPNYIFTEYLHPSKEFAKINNLIHTLRVVTVNTNGDNPRIIGGYMRFGTSMHGEANHMSKNVDSQSLFDFLVDVDFDKGRIHNSKLVYFDKVVDSPKHPESQVLVDMEIPNWTKLKSEILGIARYFGNLEFLGFDFGITDMGPKLMEINTHPGIKYMQLFHSLYEDEKTKMWLKGKL